MSLTTVNRCLYVDLHLVHEVTSPQAFSGLRAAGRKVRRPDRTFATVDHNVPTTARHLPITDALALGQIDALRHNCAEFGVPLFDLHSAEQGIVHVIGPELGLTQPGKTIVCGDSHTTTHGAFGALAFGIGTTEVEQVLATQCLVRRKPKALLVQLDGALAPGVSAKDVALAVVSQLGMAGGTGHIIEFAGSLVSSLTMEQRMTLCNMSIEAGATAALVAPDEVTFTYLAGRRFAPADVAWPAAVSRWRQLASDPGAVRQRRARAHRDARAAGHLGHAARHGRGRSPAPCRTRSRPATRPIARRWSARSSTWRSNQARA